jgi:hypothetical protein
VASKPYVYNEAGVYVFRTRRPGLLGRAPSVIWWPLLAGWAVTIWVYTGRWWLMPLVMLLNNRHTAYVGESLQVNSRKLTHLKGSVKFNAMPKPWSDLKPSHYFLPLPPFKPILHAVETLVILLLWPVYNHQKNLWNPRRIPLRAAIRQRGSRDFTGGVWSFNFRYGHLIMWATAFAVAWERGWMSWVSHLF